MKLVCFRFEWSRGARATTSEPPNTSKFSCAKHLDKGPRTANDHCFYWEAKKTIINLHRSACTRSTRNRWAHMLLSGFGWRTDMKTYEGRRKEWESKTSTREILELHRKGDCEDVSVRMMHNCTQRALLLEVNFTDDYVQPVNDQHVWSADYNLGNLKVKSIDCWKRRREMIKLE